MARMHERIEILRTLIEDYNLNRDEEMMVHVLLTQLAWPGRYTLAESEMMIRALLTRSANAQ